MLVDTPKYKFFPELIEYEEEGFYSQTNLSKQQNIKGIGSLYKG